MPRPSLLILLGALTLASTSPSLAQGGSAQSGAGPSAPAQGAGSYTVQPGDTAYSVARRAGLSVDALLALNRLSSPDLKPGQVLRLAPLSAPASIPAAATHTVQAGETAYGIAREAGLKLAALLTLNGLSSPDLRVGQVLVLRAPEGAPPPAAVAVAPLPPVPRFSVPPAPVLPAPAPPVPPTPAAPPLAHSVQPGETAYGIARQYGVALDALLAANGLTPASPDLSLGQVLTLPDGVAASPAADDSAGISPPAPQLQDWRSVALSFVGVPYAYGGSSRRGTDCSGLVVQIFGPLGLRLPHRSADMARSGQPVDGELLPGDLLFFDTEGRGQVSHVGVYLGDGTFISANSYDGAVAVDRMTDKYFAPRYLWARRVLGALAQDH